MDRAYEDNKTRALAEEHGFNVVVPPKKNRKDPWEYDKELYKKRNQVERYFLRPESVKLSKVQNGKQDLKTQRPKRCFC